ncbi:MAG: N-acetylglucosamine-6-phosphate deacetylase [Lachnospiraceae bacterium]
MKIINCHKYEEGAFSKKEIYIEGAYFSDKSGCFREKNTNNKDDIDEDIFDAQGCYAIPGLIDLHFHGCAGVDFCDGNLEAIHRMARYELQNGITTIHPATMTLSEEMLTQIGQTAKEYVAWQQARGFGELKESEQPEAELAGIYMEGPFVSMEKKGAQNPLYVHKPDASMFRRLQEASGNLYRITVVAPETEGGLDFIDEVKDEIRISVAHTTANYDVARDAFQRGARQVTHLYNAMPAFTHRAPGVVGAACENENVMVELICDGVHIHPATISATFKMFGNDRIIMISDSMMATGMPDGQYSLGGQDVTVKGNLAVLTQDGAIAGSVTNLYQCLKYVVTKVGIPLEKAVRCVTENPAKAIGVWDEKGSITAGKYADLLLVDEQMNLRAVFQHGVKVFDR